MDHGAFTPTDPRVVETMIPYMTKSFGNPSSLHSYGVETQEALEEAREKVAALISAKKREEVIFTSGGTESNNLGIKGVALRNKKKGNHIITTAIEHISVLNICKHLEKQGFKVTHIPVDEHGLVDPERLNEAIKEETILISVMYANGEIGTIQPIKQIGKIAHEKDIYLHVDAVAAAGQMPVNVEEENIDLLSLSSNNLYGPQGVGALYVRANTRIEPIIHGGGQERGLRSSTENIAGIVGMGRAAEIAKNEMRTLNDSLTELRDRLIKEVSAEVPYSYLNGHPDKRLPNNANFRFSFIEGEALILSMDMEGVAASTGSACTSKTLEPSHVLLAIGLKHEEAHGSLLLSLGRQNTGEDVDYVLEVLPRTVKRLRMISPLTPKELLEEYNSV